MSKMEIRYFSAILFAAIAMIVLFYLSVNP